MSASQLLNEFAAWLGTTRQETIDLLGVLASVLSAVVALIAVCVAVATASAARRDTNSANERLEKYQTDRDREERQRRADERAELSAFTEAGAGFVRVRARWLDTSDTSFWRFEWAVTGRAEMRILEARTESPFVLNGHDTRPVDLLLNLQDPGSKFVRPDSEGIASFAAQAQCFVPLGTTIDEQLPIVVKFRDRQANEWLVDTSDKLTLINPRAITAQPNE